MTDTREALDRIVDDCSKKEEPVKTERSKFKIGSCETVGRYDAVIFEISDRIFGKIKLSNSEWGAMDWLRTGQNNNFQWDLRPNNLPEPKSVEFETMVGSVMDTGFMKCHPHLDTFVGKRVKVVVTAIEDGK